MCRTEVRIQPRRSACKYKFFFSEKNMVPRFFCKNRCQFSSQTSKTSNLRECLNLSYLVKSLLKTPEFFKLESRVNMSVHITILSGNFTTHTTVLVRTWTLFESGTQEETQSLKIKPTSCKKWREGRWVDWAEGKVFWLGNSKPTSH